MNTIATTIAELRVLVGYLGEKGQANWWGSEFFSATATAFLAPIFNRSLFLAQYQGATAAAAKVHDEAIGVGRIFHLFRLPAVAFETVIDEQGTNPILKQRQPLHVVCGSECRRRDRAPSKHHP